MQDPVKSTGLGRLQYDNHLEQFILCIVSEYTESEFSQHPPTAFWIVVVAPSCAVVTSLGSKYYSGFITPPAPCIYSKQSFSTFGKDF